MKRVMRRRLGEAGWRAVLARFAASGRTAAAFCREESICVASFYRWRSLLGLEVSDVVQQPETVKGGGVVASTAFVDLGPLSAARSSTERFELRLDLGGGLLLHLVRG